MLKEQSKNEFDVLFLDIDMPETSGIDVANQIRKYNDNIIIIFVTNMEQLVFETIKYSPFRFVRKQKINEDLKEALESLIKKVSRENIIYKFRSEGENVRIKLSDIIYFESFRHDVELHMIGGNTVSVPDTLESLQNKFEAAGFIRIHKSYLVNYKYILSFDKTSLILDDHSILPISRYRLNDSKQMYSHFVKENMQ